VPSSLGSGIVRARCRALVHLVIHQNAVDDVDHTVLHEHVWLDDASGGSGSGGSNGAVGNLKGVSVSGVVALGVVLGSFFFA